MYIFFQNNQYLGSYYFTGSENDPVHRGVCAVACLVDSIEILQCNVDIVDVDIRQCSIVDVRQT